MKRSVLVCIQRQLTYQDAPRLLIYTGIGIMGAWTSVLFIDYFRVRMIELVKIS